MKPHRHRRNRPNMLLEPLEGRELFSANMPMKLPARNIGETAVSAAAGGQGRKHQAPTPVTQPTGTNLPSFTPTALASAAATVSTLPGDANSDWTVNAFDLNIVSSNWKSTNATWSTGDFNGDATVDTFDLNILSAHWGVSMVPPTAQELVPLVSYDWHTQTINGVLNVWAPNPGDFGSTYTVSDPAKLFGPDGIPNLEGVHQGPIGDCYFLSAIGGTAKDRPGAIMNIVKADDTGGWAVTFQWRNPAGLTVPVTFHTSRELSAGMQTEANGEVWALVMEKAYAAFRTFNGVTSTNTMASIAWGYAGNAETHIGQSYTPYYTSGQGETTLYAWLSGARTQGRPVLFHTNSSAPSMVASHVYVITGVTIDAAGTRQVTTYNPWGFYETRTLTDLMRNGTGQIVIANAA